MLKLDLHVATFVISGTVSESCQSMTRSPALIWYVGELSVDPSSSYICVSMSVCIGVGTGGAGGGPGPPDFFV